MDASFAGPRATLVTANQPAERFYLGGGKIRRFRSSSASPADGPRVPEDWVASVTTLFGAEATGLSRLPDGRLLRDEIRRDPVAWLGPDHVAQWGDDSKLLVKLLDAGQRLPVHSHPAGAFARQHLGRPHGKAEAWYLVDGGTVHLGFTRPVGIDELAEWVREQNTESMIQVMHTIEVAAGDSVYVPPGLPHAIGEGIFLVEVQEPEDLSILLEWKGFEIDGMRAGHLGIGFPTALAAVDRRGWGERDIRNLVMNAPAGPDVLAAGAGEFFRAERYEATVSSPVSLPAGFGGTGCLAGSGSLRFADGTELAIARGDTVCTPHAAGTITLLGEVSLLRCQPPLPETGGDNR